MCGVLWEDWTSPLFFSCFPAACMAVFLPEQLYFMHSHARLLLCNFRLAFFAGHVDVRRLPLCLLHWYNFQVVKWLVSQGAPLNQRDWESGYTPLHRALFYGHLGSACTLIQVSFFIFKHSVLAARLQEHYSCLLCLQQKLGLNLLHIEMFQQYSCFYFH